ncbi:ABC transporter ATP-binding protein [Salipiger abyssi]|uniref:ABC transporter ATP-binding protein n=1 Tax=Salipiger abyssi TaxID=1250539 RepID=UPI001A8EF271|nr:oligopeptide/dipeptide ABC transporter ATP-binding protein [Salipiger abyssi]MBN9888268.1 ATP-binding cassette domain-containing protein [Salipiger abyssi]
MTRSLELVNLSLHHPTPAGPLRAVDGVNLTLNKAETLGLVGESGCGKSSLARCVVGLNTPQEGSIVVGGQALGTSAADRRAAAQRVQMVFQDPMGSLNPRHTVRRSIEQPLKIHGRGSAAERRARVEELAAQVGLGLHLLDRYPHQISGGQRQRVSIARALTLEPELIVCDEAVSALDVSVQAQVLNLLTKLQRDLGVSFLFISHDLSVVRYVSHRIAVMYLGQIVELGDAESVWAERRHPYTRALTSSIPDAAGGMRGERLTGDVPSAVNPPSGCPFRTRCRHAQAICAEARPALTDDGLPHLVACHFARDFAPLERESPPVQAATGG